MAPGAMWSCNAKCQVRPRGYHLVSPWDQKRRVAFIPIDPWLMGSSFCVWSADHGTLTPALASCVTSTVWIVLSELQVPEWQELAKDRPKWRKMSKSIKIRR
jgi:hypothetical protein